MTLIESLQNPKLYNHEITDFEVVETHTSWVLLTGEYAYKIKKSVKFDFLDFSTLEKRHFFYQKELERNKSLAAHIYLEILPITGNIKKPEISGTGPVIEYALKMRQFDNDNVLKTLQNKRKLPVRHINTVARILSDFHKKAEKVEPSSNRGSFEHIAQPMLDNFTSCYKLTKDPKVISKLKRLEQWTKQELNNLQPILESRKDNGFIRNCHGDLYLNNMVLINGKPTIFDCIDFNEDFYWIDVINDIAFLMMDLIACKQYFLASAFINKYLTLTGDHQGLTLLKFYMVYRAMILAKITLLGDSAKTLESFATYINLADTLIKPEEPVLILMHGFSGSGKSSLGRKLCPYLNAIQVCSDIERKRLFKAKALPDEQLYSENTTSLTYNYLSSTAEMLLQAGYTTIIDATFLQQSKRQQFIEKAHAVNAKIIIVDVTADQEVLEKRLDNRNQDISISDANVDVLHMQQQHHEPLTTEELKYTIPAVAPRTKPKLEKLVYQIKKFITLI